MKLPSVGAVLPCCFATTRSLAAEVALALAEPAGAPKPPPPLLPSAESREVAKQHKGRACLPCSLNSRCRRILLTGTPQPCQQVSGPAPVGPKVARAAPLSVPNLHLPNT